MRIVEDTQHRLVVEDSDRLRQRIGYFVAGLLVLVGIGGHTKYGEWPPEPVGVLIVFGIFSACWVYWFWDVETRLTLDQGQTTLSLFTRSRRKTRLLAIQFKDIRGVCVADPYGDSRHIKVEHIGHEPFILTFAPYGETLESFADKLRDRLSLYSNGIQT